MSRSRNKRLLPSIAGLFLLLVPSLAMLSPEPVWGFRFGVNADNWDRQIKKPAFVEALRRMKVEFIVWHLSPEEEVSPERLMEIVNFCRQNNWGYLFNTELVNYVPKVPHFQQPDGTYRWDLKPPTMKQLENDPLFLGVVYDEPELMQSMLGVKLKDNAVPPYFADTRKLDPRDAYEEVVKKTKELVNYYGRSKKRLVFEMVFPDYAHGPARGGAILAPKLLKENFNDLMYYVYAGAARQYSLPELWACVDLWFLDKFPEAGRTKPGGHTPEELYQALLFAFERGFDYVYVEHMKGLADQSFNLTAYGRKVVEFQNTRTTPRSLSWRTFVPQQVIKRFPDGYWGQKYSSFIPNHPYGAWIKDETPSAEALSWLKLLNRLSQGKIPGEANNWNAVNHDYFRRTPYIAEANLPPLLVLDHLFTLPGSFAQAQTIDLTSKKDQ
ncbi:MAG: hypothetical protein AB1641_08030 [Thermodesulfobacteriota bacterium]